jgi:hypothetical protein
LTLQRSPATPQSLHRRRDLGYPQPHRPDLASAASTAADGETSTETLD